VIRSSDEDSAKLSVGNRVFGEVVGEPFRRLVAFGVVIVIPLVAEHVGYRPVRFSGEDEPCCFGRTELGVKLTRLHMVGEAGQVVSAERVLYLGHHPDALRFVLREPEEGAGARPGRRANPTAGWQRRSRSIC
jgi:hypothetical protein